MSAPRWMTLVASLAGTAFTIAFYMHERDADMSRISPGYLMLGLPFVLGAAVSVWPMHKRARIMLYWLTALLIGFGGALTLFGGIGIYNVFTVIVFLIAAWFENQSGEPLIPRRRDSITTNPRSLSR